MYATQPGTRTGWDATALALALKYICLILFIIYLKIKDFRHLMNSRLLLPTYDY